MSAHDHRDFVPGCFRCELGRDESAFAAAQARVERSHFMATLREHQDAIAADMTAELQKQFPANDLHVEWVTE